MGLRRRMGRALLLAGGVVWASAVVGGMWAVWSYAHAPGAPADPPRLWSPDVPLARDPARPTLLLLAHPRCPCTRATLGELDRILTRTDTPLTAHVLFYRPAGFADGWERTDLWEHATRIPGLRVRRDDDGRIARRFGGATSGQVLLYDGDGRLRFHGGITAARGHAGDSVGGTLVRRLLDRDRTASARATVYGCPLLGADRERRCAEGGASG